MPSNLNLSASASPAATTVGTPVSVAGAVSSDTAMTHLDLTYSWGDSTTNDDPINPAPPTTQQLIGHSHGYAAAGKYTVTVTAGATYDGGGSDTATETYSVTVTASPPPPSPPPPPALAQVSVAKLADATRSGDPGMFEFDRTGGDLTQPLTVSYSVSGSATPDVDYDALTGAVTFEANAETATTTVTAIDDLSYHPDQTVTVVLSEGSDYTVWTPAGIQTITIVRNPATITGQVFVDSNGNGLPDSGEVGLPSATVTLTYPNGNAVTDATGTAVGATTTGTDGKYTFGNLLPGTYAVNFTVPTSYLLDGTSNTWATSITVQPGHTTEESPPAYVTGTLATVSGTAWVDGYADGQQESGETGLPAVGVTVLDATGTTVGTASTNSDGHYTISGLAPGTYSVHFTTPAGFTFEQSGAATLIVTATTPGPNATASAAVGAPGDETEYDSGDVTLPESEGFFYDSATDEGDSYSGGDTAPPPLAPSPPGAPPTSANLKWSDFTEVATAPVMGEDAMIAYRRVPNGKATFSDSGPEYLGVPGSEYMDLVYAQVGPMTYSAVFDAARSWVVKTSETDALLDHERTHLKIAEYVAQKMAVNFPTISAAGGGFGSTEQGASDAAKSNARGNLQAKINSVMNTWKNIDVAVQTLYDSESESAHGTNAIEQVWWNNNYKDMVDKEFKKNGLK